MKRVKPIIHSAAGFTLVEIIITIVAAAIMGLIFTSLMGTAMENSWKSIDMVASEADAEGKMNEVITSYIKEMNSNPDNALAIMKQKVEDNDFGDSVSMQYITFDSSGNEQTSGTQTNTVKVTVDAPGKDFITIITKSRNSIDAIVTY